MAETAVGEAIKGAKETVTGAKGTGKHKVWHTVGYVIGGVIIIGLAYRFRAKIVGFIGGLPIIGKAFTAITGPVA